jgi:hypothetical protein
MALKKDCMIEPFALNAKATYQNDTTGIIYSYADWLNKDTKNVGLIPGDFVSSLSLNTAIQQASLGSAVLMQALNGTPEIPRNRISNATVSHSALISGTIQVDKYTDYATQLLAQLSNIYQLDSEINTLSDLLSSNDGWKVKQDITFTGVISTSANNQQDIPNIKNKDLITKNIYAEDAKQTSGDTSIPIIVVGYAKPTAKEDKPVTINTDDFNIYTKYDTSKNSVVANSSIQNAAACIESLATRLKSAETKINNLGFKTGSITNFISGATLKTQGLCAIVTIPSFQIGNNSTINYTGTMSCKAKDSTTIIMYGASIIPVGGHGTPTAVKVTLQITGNTIKLTSDHAPQYGATFNSVPIGFEIAL